MLFVLILLLPLFAAASTRQSSSAGDQQVPRDSIPQYIPCTDQPKSFTELSGSFAAGRLPSPSDVTGSWALIGIWVHKDSRPDLNCNGVKRGRKFEWILVAHGYSVEVDSIGTKRQTTIFKPDHKGNLTFSIDLEGDYVPNFRCRLTQRNTLACLGSPYYDAVEFKKISANAESTPQ